MRGRAGGDGDGDVGGGGGGGDYHVLQLPRAPLSHTLTLSLPFLTASLSR